MSVVLVSSLTVEHSLSADLAISFIQALRIQSSFVTSFIYGVLPKYFSLSIVLLVRRSCKPMSLVHVIEQVQLVLKLVIQ